jgi:hypothetical protein
LFAANIMLPESKQGMLIHIFAKKAWASVRTIEFVLWGLLGVTTPVGAQVQTAVEYGYYAYWDDCYYATYSGPIVCDSDCYQYLDKIGRQNVCYYSSYFVTSAPDEIAALDAGAYDMFAGQFVWQRTGEAFNVWGGLEAGALPTCRFWNATFGNAVEHFYTPYPAECAAVQANVDWHWQYEGIAFYLQVPDENGNCPVGTTILYRLYWDKEGPLRHHFTTSAATFNRDLAAGWVFEGDGRTFAFACVPSSTAPSTP